MSHFHFFLLARSRFWSSIVAASLCLLLGCKTAAPEVVTPSFTPPGGPGSIMPTRTIQALLPTFTLAPPTATSLPISIGGKVTSAATSEPLSGATLSLVETFNPFNEIASTTTGPSGEYAFHFLSPGNYYLVASAPGFAREIFPQAAAIQEAMVLRFEGFPLVTVDFALSAGGSIAGRVLSSDDNTPLKDILVGAIVSKYAWADALRFNTLSDAEGYYKIESLPLGEYVVFTEGISGYQNEFFDDANYLSKFTPVLVTPPYDTSAIDLTLERGATISGKVVDEETGLPISNAMVQMWSHQILPTWGLTSHTNGRGEFIIDTLPPASFLISVRAEGYADEIYNHRQGWDQADLVPVTYGSVSSGVAINMRKGGILRGALYDQSGSPLAGLMVDVRNGDNDHASAVPCYPTDINGEFSVMMPPGTYYLYTQFVPGFVQVYYDNVLDFASATPIKVTVGEEVTGLDFFLLPGGVISGKVVRSDGVTPVADVQVLAKPLGGQLAVSMRADRFSARANTGQDGTFRIEGLPSGSYLLLFTIPGQVATIYYPGVTKESQATPVEVKAPEETSGLIITIP